MKIPTEVTIPARVDDELTQLRRDCSEIRTHYATLRRVQGLQVPIDLNQINADILTRWNDVNMKAIANDATISEITRINKRIAHARRRRIALVAINGIADILRRNPDVCFAFDESLESIEPQQEIEDVARNRATMPVPQEAQQYADVIESIMKLKKQLDTIASDCLLPYHSLPSAINMKADDIAQMFATAANNQ